MQLSIWCQQNLVYNLMDGADGKSQVKQCLSFCTADFWSLLSYKSAEQKSKHCLTWDILSALLMDLPANASRSPRPTRLRCASVGTMPLTEGPDREQLASNGYAFHCPDASRAFKYRGVMIRIQKKWNRYTSTLEWVPHSPHTMPLSSTKVRFSHVWEPPECRSNRK